jgi:ribokinase
LELFSIGNINLDITFKLHRMPSLDENIRTNESWIGTGGSAVNYSIAIRKLGRYVNLVARAGRDAGKLGLLDYLEEVGVNTEYVSIDDVYDTGKVVILLLLDNDSRVLITYRGANDRLSLDDIPCNDQRALYHFASVNPELVIAFSEKCRSHILSYDPGGWVFNNPYGVIDTAQHVDILHMNRVEYLSIRERTHVDLETIQVTTGRPSIMTVKRGEEGAYLYWGKRKYSGHLESASIQVIDTTGAGDAFDAAFNLTYIETGNPLLALKKAIAAGSLKVTRLGSSNMPDKHDVEKFSTQVFVSRIDLS